MKWFWLLFAELTPKQLYDVLQLREAVFVLEQRCLYQDLDNIDIQAKHLLGYERDRLVAYLRIYMHKETMRLGRIVVLKLNRGVGLGQMMVRRTVSYIQEHYSDYPIELAAQYDQRDFYGSMGFAVAGDPYDDAGIRHIHMRYVGS